MEWRRSYDTPPPPMPDDNEFSQASDARYADLPDELLPRTEALAQVLDRMLPYWYDSIVPDLLSGKVTLVTAHGNSLRALVKHLDGLSEEAVVGLNIPTGIPLVYELEDDLKAIRSFYVGDPETVKKATEAVGAQLTKKE
jgi:2,3-bisphosphoglycerate-dependent phosphoglycerate mutase